MPLNVLVPPLLKSERTRWFAIAALSALLILFVTGVGYLDRLDPWQFAVGGLDDTALHTATIGRLAAGDPYYAAVGSELQQRGYPTASIPNWRTPLHYSVVAQLGVDLSSWLIVTLASLSTLLGAVALRSIFRFAGGVGLLVLFGAMLPVWGAPARAAVFAENWSGVLIALALAAYHLRWFSSAAGVALVALFTRELVAPFALVCALAAFSSGRRRESQIWVIGGALYGIYYLLHAAAASSAMAPDAWAWSQSWIRWLGWSFVLQTVWTSGWTMLLPDVATPLVATLGLAGAAAPGMPPQARASILLYAVLFCAVGQEFNFYWGWVTAPVWAYGLMYSPLGLAKLWRDASGRSAAAPSRGRENSASRMFE